jgi:hypothetical protein
MKARLAIAIAIAVASIALGVTTQAFAVGAPAQVSPDIEASFTSGDRITFSASVTAPFPDQMDFYVSRDIEIRSNGTLLNRIGIVGGDPTGGDPLVFTGSTSSDVSWPDRPDTYYWQAVYHDCAQAGPYAPGCLNVSLTRSFKIKPRPASTVGRGNEPKTFLTSHPRHRTHKRKVTFAYISDVKGAHFQCFYAQGWAKCRSPDTFRHLKPGRFKFEVRAVVNGVEDPSPASWVFRVLR